MRLLFASDRLHVPDDHSGSVQSTHTLVRGLAARGYDCRVLATLRPGTRHRLATVGYRLSGRRLIAEWEDSDLGYSVRRGSEWRLAERLEREIRRTQPDVLILDAPRQLKVLEGVALARSLPVVVVLHELASDWVGHAPTRPGRITYVANSPFTANAFRSATGIAARVISPAIDIRRYLSARTSPTFVTMISPTRDKGIQTALHLAAAFRKVPFLLVEGWPMSAPQWDALHHMVSNYQNVTLSRAVTDIRDVYRRTRVLLVPSIVQETFGRVVVEAQASGIPVLARDVGALNWVVGTGGRTVDASLPDPAWKVPLGDLLSDGNLYAEISENARANALRLEFDLEYTLDAYARLFAHCDQLTS